MAHAFYAYTPAWTSYTREFSDSDLQHTGKPRRRRRALSYHVRVGTATLCMTLCLMMTVLMIALLWHANSAVTKGYFMRELVAERAGLLTENHVLKQSVAELRSLATIEQSSLFSALVPVHGDDVKYVHHRDNVIATTAR